MQRRKTGTCQRLALAILTVGVLAGTASIAVRASGDVADEGCPTLNLSCNEQRVIRDPGHCGEDPWLPCDGYNAPELCDELASCKGVTGQYPQMLPQECLDCNERERADGGICDCVHCLNAPTLGLCQKIYMCKRIVAGAPPKVICVPHGYCSASYDTHKYEIACPPTPR